MTTLGQTVITKGCNTVCAPTSTGDITNGIVTSCCGTNLCNSASDFKATVSASVTVTFLAITLKISSLLI